MHRKKIKIEETKTVFFQEKSEREAAAAAQNDNFRKCSDFSHLSPKMPRILEGLGWSLDSEPDLDLDLEKRRPSGDLDRLDDRRRRRAGDGVRDRGIVGLGCKELSAIRAQLTLSGTHD